MLDCDRAERRYVAQLVQVLLPLDCPLAAAAVQCGASLQVWNVYVFLHL